MILEEGWSHCCSLPTGGPLQTTLMDVLAGRKTGGVITGDIRVNGAPCWVMLESSGASCRGIGVQASVPTASALSSKTNRLPRPALQATPRCTTPLHVSAAMWSRRVGGDLEWHSGWPAICMPLLGCTSRRVRLRPLSSACPPSATDIHVPFATVHEALQLSARLRLPSHISQQKEKTETFVREVSCFTCAAGLAWRR